MASPIQDIIDSLQQVPVQLAKGFTDILVAITRAMVQRAAQQFALGQSSTISATGEQGKRRVPFVPKLDNFELPDNCKPDSEEYKTPGPGL